MAEQSQNPGAVTNTFSKGMVKDMNESFVGEGLWTHARNAVNNSHDGQMGVLGNEPANLHCVTLPYDLIGTIHLSDDLWAVFTTNDVDSEIGIFDESKCSYRKVVNDKCLGFKRSHLITGASRKRFDCAYPVYWSDGGRNPDRFMDLDNPPFKFTEKVVDGCVTRTYSTQLDCEKIRLAPLMTQPCLTLTKGKGLGTLANGSYQVCMAYTINQNKIGDYIGFSNIQGVFSHENLNGSLEVTISEIDQDFDEFELVIISTINAQTVARRLGYYSTNQGTIYIDQVNPEQVSVPISQIPLRTEAIESSDAMYAVNNYLLRVGTYSRYAFNYQQQANKIQTKWVAVEYPSDYYYKAGSNVGYLRDEQYPFFIRWIYNTGERSASFHIPGRAALQSDLEPVIGDDAYESASGVQTPRWQVQNTATVDGLTSFTLPDGGRVIATGKMGYWQSTEKYPDYTPEIWGDLCGKNIRHHKFPDVTVHPAINHFSNGGQNIVVMGVQFENITHPLDDKGNPITSIVGYEILRGSRQGNKSILAKGLLNNMREYNIPGVTSIKGLFQNYPYNDLRPDSYLTNQEQRGDNGQADVSSTKMTAYKKNVFSFHSPDVTFTNPFLSAYELKVYQQMTGTANGYFETPFKHPRFKVPTNFSSIFGDLIGIIGTISSIAATVGGGFDLAMEADQNTPVKLPLIATPNYAGDYSTVLGSGTSVITIAQFAATTVANGLMLTTLIGTGVLPGIYKEQFMRLLTYLMPRRQYAAQYNSHGFYNASTAAPENQRRRQVINSTYTNGNGLQYFNDKYQINNLFRSNALVVETGKDIANPIGVTDNSRFTIGDRSLNLNQTVTSTIASHYGALKFSIPSQYGYLDSVKQMLVPGCTGETVPSKIAKLKTDVLFGGDIYINRFTEKNSMFFFNNWLMGEPDETVYDYTAYINVPYPRFWLNNEEKHSAFFELASKQRALDHRESGFLHVKRGYFYLFNSGVRDFFVESEVNVAYRDWEDEFAKRHYDPLRYTDISMMFRSDIIRSGNYYKYDYSLSASTLYNNMISWGNVYTRDYNPAIASSCYVYQPNKVIYSLPQELEFKRDNWRVFLTNNYKDFTSPVTSIKNVNRTGALFMMRRQSPLQFMGVDQLQTDAGTKITLGDGGLFQQPLQNLVNSDESYEYGSSQSKFATVGCTHGVFWVSQDQGKVFQYAGGLNEISRDGMKWWFAKYLPSELLRVYPDYPLADNPVKGIGVQMIYDNTHELIYISKKDYKPKRNDLLYDEGGFYYISGYQTVTIPGGTTTTCPPGYSLQNGQCIRMETADVIQSGSVVNVTRTPYYVYGSLGTRVYNTASVGSTFTLLNTANPFWKRLANPPGWNLFSDASKQALDLDRGPVNRLAVWGVQTDGSGNVLNNYTIGGGSLPPVNEWIGFDVCINITETKTYYVCIAADNYYRFSLDGNVLLSDTTGNTAAFEYLHIYPVTITAGSHILKVEGRNTGQLAGFGCEILDLSARPSGMSVVEFLNQQTNYDVLDGMTVFTTRNVTQFSSNLYSCPVGFGLTNPTCNQPVCSRIFTATPTTVTNPPTTIRTPIKVYVGFDNPEFWEDASWTISYDPKSKMWISFHDWKPTFVIPGKQHFMTVKNAGIWKHNVRCDLFCNYYDKDYPFEVEFVSATGQMVSTVRNIEYLMEAYKFYNDCRDKFHILDENFDQAMIYNSEQVSGLLELNLKSKINPLELLSYPQVGTTSIKIHYAKEEHKYRFNQFWDITKNRGEFNPNDTPMFNTAPDGYQFQINPGYVDYQKPVLQRKKFRHNVNRVWLCKKVSGDKKFLFKISNQKILQSPR